MIFFLDCQINKKGSIKYTCIEWKSDLGCYGTGGRKRWVYILTSYIFKAWKRILPGVDRTRGRRYFIS